jgi:hypothetical protein
MAQGLPGAANELKSDFMASGWQNDILEKVVSLIERRCAKTVAGM